MQSAIPNQYVANHDVQAHQDILRRVFVLNRFFYFLCRNCSSMKEIYNKLNISKTSFLTIINPIIRSMGRGYGFRDVVRFSRLIEFDDLSALPIYRLFGNGLLTIDNFKDIYIELLIPKEDQFDLGFCP